jgi:hypothetical protein
VTEPRDELETWLQREVTPMFPPPGSFDRIRRRARARKRRQAVLAAVGCAVLAAGVAAGPRLASALEHRSGGSPPRLAQGTPHVPRQSTAGGGGTTGPKTATSHAVQISQRTTLSHSWTVPPANFQPTSITFVGNGSGGLLGAAIGQAGTPGHCATKDCTSLAGTSNYGQSWHGVSAPVAPGPAEPSGVSQLRFANPDDGWAFGPALYETTGGGWPWRRVQTNGMRVTDLETVGQTALAVFASCSGSGADFASDCTSFSLYSGRAGAATWSAVDVPAKFLHMSTATASSATLVISGTTTAYLLTPSGAVLSGPVSGGKWTLAGQAPAGCLPGPPQADGQPTDAQLAAGDNRLLLACDTGSSSSATEQTVLYSSADGTTWRRVGPVLHSGAANSLGTALTGNAVLATTTGIYYSANGTSWRPASLSQAGGPAGGFSYVGMTTQQLGVAVPENAKLGEIFVTSDGGQTWTASPIEG